MSTQLYTFKSPAIMRKGLRAYLGLHVSAYEALMAQSEKAQGFTQTQIDNFAARGTKIETGVSSLFEKTPKFIRRATPCGMATTMGIVPKKRRVAELEATLEGLKGELASLEKSAKTTTKAAKKVIKKTITKTVPVKIVTKVSTAATAKPARHIAYWDAVRAYDADASEAIVKKIVNHCGIALTNNDGKFVACSDESERATVRDSWLVKKLGLTDDIKVLDAKVMTVCDVMKADRFKSRVTFYYLLAKAEGKLGAL